MKRRKESNESTSRKRKNPFLQAQKSAFPATANKHHQQVLARVLSFSNASRQKRKGQDESHELVECVRALLVYLESDEEPTNTSSSSARPLLSRADVANMLLQWAVKNLVHVSSNSKATNSQDSILLYWKTLRCCLVVILARKEDASAVHVSSGSLSQSTLHKLVPYAAPTALDAKQETDAAICYTMLVDHFYRPNMDSACHSLLPLVDEHLAKHASMKESRLVLVSDDHLRVLESTVQLLKRLQSTCNPKKTFQLLAEPGVLSALSRWRLASTRGDSSSSTSSLDATIRELLWEGLFSPLHHIDGFRSMNVAVPVVNQTTDSRQGQRGQTQKSFHCYQETLLKTISLLIGGASDDKITSTNNDSIVSMALVVPDLVNGLIEMFASWERDSGAKLKRKNGRDMAPVQFRLWSNLVYPIIEKLEKRVSNITEEKEEKLPIVSDSTLALLCSLRETLSLVLKHNLYLPSHKDENNVSFSYLEAIASIFLEVHSEAAKRVESEDAVRIEDECLRGLETLLRLNHLVVHERLPLLIAVSGSGASHSSLEQQGLVGMHQRDLMLAIIQTYHRLRQLDHLFDSMLKATNTIQGQIVGGKTSASQLGGTLTRLLLENKIRQELAAAITKCPPNQVKDLFEILNRWVHECASKNYSTEESRDVSFAVNLFVLLIKNVRVDVHTSLAVSVLCDESIKKAVYPLILGSRTSNLDLKREGLVLTGWLVDLNNRCAFWLDRVDKNNEQSSSLDIVQGVLEVTGIDKILAGDDRTSESFIGSIPHELQFLLLHRIRELHTIIYEEQRAELTCPNSTRGKSSSADEARRLVNVVIANAENSCSLSRASPAVSTSAWKPLAGAVSYWVPYSEARHVEAFLSWMFSAISASVQEPSEGNNTEDIAVAEALLRDASFFEIPELATHFHRVGVRCVLDLVRHAVERNSSQSNSVVEPLVFKGLDLMSSSDQPSVEDLGGAMSAVASANKKLLKDRALDSDSLNRATQIIRLLNGVPLPPDGTDSGRLMQLDVLACALGSKSLSTYAAILPMLCAQRTYMARLVSEGCDFLDDKGLGVLVRGYVETTAKVLKHISSAEDKELLLRASAALIESLSTACLSVSKARPESLKCLVGCFRDLFVNNNDGDYEDYLVLMSLSRSLLKRLSAHFQSQPLDAPEFIQQLVQSVQKSFGAWYEPYLGSESMRAEWLLLTGDTARLASVVNPTSIDDHAAVLTGLEKSLESSHESIKRAAYYALSCIVACGRPSSSIVDLVVGECLAGSNQLLDATFCGLVRAMDASDIHGLLERLLGEARASTDGKLHALHLFHLILDHVEGEPGRMELSHLARAFFALSLDLLCPFDGADLSSWTKGCRLGTSLLIALLENKDIMTIRERDLALILVQVASSLGTGGTFRKPDVPTVDAQVYSSCFMLVSSLLQRFPKQLYACAPTVILTVHVLLKHALYGSLEDQDVAARTQMFTRLCELLVPHREVYKKHVLGLMLEYVGALQSGISPARSKAIVPAINCLLDMLSQFETDQLNTMMDTTSKALFRSVYQSHQKTHMYKGQY